MRKEIIDQEEGDLFNYLDKKTGDKMIQERAKEKAKLLT